MILSSDDTVRPIPRYKVIQLPRYGRALSDDTVMDHREILLIYRLVYAHLNKGDYLAPIA